MSVGQRHQVQWRDFRLVVEERPNRYRAYVYSLNGSEPLYTAEQGSVNAAKFAAVEFAIKNNGCDRGLTPESLISQLSWVSEG